MVAVYSRSHSKIGNVTALGGLTGAVSSDGIAKDTGGPYSTATLVSSCNINRIGNILGSNIYKQDIAKILEEYAPEI